MEIDIVSISIAIVALGVSIISIFFDRGKLRITRAIELSKEYTVFIADISTIIGIASENPDITRLLSKNKLSGESEFTAKELKSIYTDTEIKLLSDFFSYESVASSLLTSIYIDDKFDAVNITPSANHFAIAVNPDLLKSHFRAKTTSLLNNLECFSMNFISNVADSKVVYQSLHQTFIEVVRVLYYLISKNNTSEHEKFYTNIVSLYRKWLLMESKQKREYNKIEMRYKKRKRMQNRKLQKRL